MRMRTFFCLFLTMTACTSHHNNLNSVLWVQTSFEYKAEAIQTYRSAMQNLQAAIDDKGWTAALEQTGAFENLPPSVVLDVDETVLDNSPYQARLVIDRDEFDDKTWDLWIKEKKAKAIPGAVEFIQAAQDKGVAVFLVTNRECKKRKANGEECPQEGETLDNLKSVGILKINPESLLLKGEREDWKSEKKTRREFLARNYRLLMLIGDDLGDFLPGVKSGVTPADREAKVDPHQENWGVKWFMLPNPTYGSWQRVLSKPRSQHLRGVLD